MIIPGVDWNEMSGASERERERIFKNPNPREKRSYGFIYIARGNREAFFLLFIYFCTRLFFASTRKRRTTHAAVRGPGARETHGCLVVIN